MELRHLRYFVAIAEERSFTRAAERLWVAQPGLSAQIRRLEAELAVQLFARHSRGVDLTAAGELFLERARAALRAADAATAVGRDIDAGVVGSVKLGLAACARWRRTCSVLQQFTRECEGIELSVLEGYGGTLWRELRGGRLDAVLAPAGFASADLHRLALGSEPWVVLIGRSHHLADRVGPLSAEDLEGQQIAVTAHRDGAEYDRAVADTLSYMGVAAEFVRTAPGPGSHGAVVDGSAVMLTTAPEVTQADVVVRPLQSDRTLEFVLLWRRDALSPAVTELIRIATACATRRARPKPVLVVAA